jgi:hypothetical protein
VLDQFWERWFGEVVKAKKMERKEMRGALCSCSSHYLIYLVTHQTKKDQWTEEYSKNLPVSVYPVKKNNEELKRKRLKPALCKTS